MSTIETRVDRPLGLLEKYQTSKQITGAYGNITLSATLEHEAIQGETADSFYLSHFQPALARLIQSHASLSSVIRDKLESTVHFEQLSSIDISQIVQIISGPASLQDLLKEETDKEFDLDSLLPLWRLKVIAETSTSCTIILALHHAIGDGMSMTIFLQSLLKELNEEKPIQHGESSIISVDKEVKLSQAYESSNSPQVTLLDVVPVVLKSLVPKVLPTSVMRMIDPISIDGWKGDNAAIEGENHDTEIRLIEVPMDIWKAIIKKSKEEGISAHAIAFVGMLLTWQQLYPGNCTEVATPINCRGLCNPPVSKDQIGNYVGAYTSFWTEKQLLNKNIWNIAKKYYQDLQKNKMNSAKQALYLKYLPEYPASYCDFWYDKRKNSSFGRTGGLELSDLGKFTTTTTNEVKWKLNRVFFCQSAQIFTTALGMNTISFNDNLYCTINWQKSALNENTSKFHDTFIHILKNSL